ADRFVVLKLLTSSVMPLGILTVVVLGVILFGITTATESAGVGAAGAFLLAFQARTLDWKRTKEAVFLTAKTTAMVCWLFVGSALFSGVFAILGGQALVEEWVLSLNMTPVQFMILSQAIIFLLGWPLEWTEIIVIFVPIFLPLLKHFNIDPVLWGVLVFVNLQAAFLSPPVAMSAFYLKGVSPPHVTLNQIFNGMMPYMVVIIVCMVIMYLWPGMTLWLPNYLYGGCGTKARQEGHGRRTHRTDRDRGRSGNRPRRRFGRGLRPRLSRPHRGARRRDQSVRPSRPRARARAGARARRAPHARPLDWAAARHSGRNQGHHRHRRLSDRARLADRQRPQASARRHRGRQAARRRRGHHRQVGDHRIRLLSSRATSQPARPRAHARRLLVGIGGGGRRPHGAACAREPDQWVGDQAGCLLRRVRSQAEPWPRLARGRAGAVAQARSYRRLRALAARPRAHPRSDRGPRSRRPRHRAIRRARFPRGAARAAAAAAALRFRAHAGLGQGRRRHQGRVRRARSGARVGGRARRSSAVVGRSLGGASHHHGGRDGAQPRPVGRARRAERSAAQAA